MKRVNSVELAKRIVTLADERKAEDPLILDLRDITIVADCFVLLTGTSRPHVLSISSYVEQELAKEKILPQQREADQDARWVLLDYGNVVVHVFQQDTRLFYNLERLWGDAQRVPLESSGV